jgi:putative DNA primase/helicase
MQNVRTHRTPLTANEIERRAKALARSKVKAEANGSASAAAAPTLEDELQIQIYLWQAELAQQAREGRGLDALPKILSTIRTQYADREDHLSRAMIELRDCADRHLEEHESATIDAIFLAVFPTANDSSQAVVSDEDVVTDEDVDQEIQRLASLSLAQYDRERATVAARLNMRVSSLDALVKAARPQAKKGQGRAFELPTIEPWGEPVNGAELLDEICTAIDSYVVMPLVSVRTLALWSLHTHCYDCFAHSPRAAIISPEKGCGKTTTLDVLGCLVARPLPTSNATVSAIFRIVELATPTLLIDEADTFLKENDELRGILNTGHRRGGQVTRTVGDDHEPRLFSTWAPAAIAMIGRLPDTLNDRSVQVGLRRRKLSEKIESFRADRAEHLKVLQSKMARWSQDNRSQLAIGEPDMGELLNRAADNWRPLFAIADQAGGDWPSRVREAARAAVKAVTEESISGQLLGDIKWIFDGCPEKNEVTVPIDRISSADLVEQLIEIDERPWAEFKSGKPLTQNSLARLLRRFEILSGTIRLADGKTAKGYHRQGFDDAFARYLPLQTGTPSQPNNDRHCDTLESVTPQSDVTLSKSQKLNNRGHCDGVTVQGGEKCAHCGEPKTQADPLLEVAIDGDFRLLHRRCMDNYAASDIPPFLRRAKAGGAS